jgi:hypothetical protein
MPEKIALDLDALDPEPLGFDAGPSDVSLESLLGGQAMAEVAASCAACSCSCCVVCCCCCFS